MILAFFATALKLDDKTVILVDDKEKETVKKVPSAKITLVHPEFLLSIFSLWVPVKTLFIYGFSSLLLFQPSLSQ
jgi:hypothetical protein